MSDLNAFLKGRQAVYEFLYLTFYKIPDYSFMPVIGQFATPFARLAGGSDNSDLQAGVTQYTDYIASIKGKSAAENAQQLNADFTRLFISGPHSISLTESKCFPNESDAEIILSLTDFFADSRIVKPSIINLPIDSYPMELFYLFKTSQQAAEAVEEERAAEIIREQIRFMDNHILRWHTDMRDAVLELDEGKEHGGFYHAAALLTSGFLMVDRDLIAAI